MADQQERADSLLVKLGLARSRQQAQELIALGLVFFKNKQITKASHALPSDTNLIEVKPHPLRDFVSRGALKLKGAIERTQFNVSKKQVLDIGVSTGGFAEYLLKAGADLVIGVDVGHGQLAEKLKSEPRLKTLEGYNARDLRSQDLVALGGPAQFDLIVMDVSFISIEHILPRCVEVLKSHGKLLSLVKPQFEVGPEHLGKGGIVKEPEQYRFVEQKLREVCKRLDLAIEDYFESEIEGTDGNREFFLYAKRN